MATGNRTDREPSHRPPSDEAARQAPDAPMTEHRRERPRILFLSAEAEVPFEDGPTRAQAERRIEELQVRCGYDPAPPAAGVRAG